MNNEFANYQIEIKKISSRIKEYLWKTRYLFKAKKYKQNSSRTKFLAKQAKSWKDFKRVRKKYLRIT